MVQKMALAGTIVRSVLSNTRFIVPMAESVRKMMDKAAGEYRQRDKEKASMTVADDELLIKSSPLRTNRPSKVVSDSRSHEKHLPSGTRCHSLFCGSPGKNLVSNGRYSIFDTDSDKSPEPESNCNHHSTDIPHLRSCHPSKQSITVTEAVDAYYRTALDYRAYRLSNSSKLYDDSLESQITKMARRLELQLR